MSRGDTLADRWTAEEDAIVIGGIKSGMFRREVHARLPHRTLIAVKCRMALLRKEPEYKQGDDRSWPAEHEAALRTGFADGLTDSQIAQRLGRTTKSVSAKRIREKLFRGPPVPASEEIPEGFAEVAAQFSLHDLASQFHRRIAVISKWRALLGIKSVVRPKKAKARTFKRQPAPKLKQCYIGPKTATPVIDTSLAALAARHLMRDYRPVCRRSTIEPKADKDLWVVGRQTLTTAELIEKAESRGFNSRLAA